MKKLTVLLSLFVVFSLIGSLAYADIFGARDQKKLKAAESIMPQTIFDYLVKIGDYLGTREGSFYDFNQSEFCNYAGVTLYTYTPWNLSANVGALNLDGIAATIDWNVGAMIPSENVPVMSLLKYLYIGGGIGARYLDVNDDTVKHWEKAYGLDGQFKMVF